MVKEEIERVKCRAGK